MGEKRKEKEGNKTKNRGRREVLKIKRRSEGEKCPEMLRDV